MLKAGMATRRRGAAAFGAREAHIDLAVRFPASGMETHLEKRLATSKGGRVVVVGARSPSWKPSAAYQPACDFCYPLPALGRTNP